MKNKLAVRLFLDEEPSCFDGEIPVQVFHHGGDDPSWIVEDAENAGWLPVSSQSFDSRPAAFEYAEGHLEKVMGAEQRLVWVGTVASRTFRAYVVGPDCLDEMRSEKKYD